VALSDWKKIDDNVWRKKKPFFGTFQYLWIDFANKVRRSHGSPNIDLFKLIKDSDILITATSERTAKEYVNDYMKKTK
jgi:hypothetical protein